MKFDLKSLRNSNLTFPYYIYNTNVWIFKQVNDIYIKSFTNYQILLRLVKLLPSTSLLENRTFEAKVLQHNKTMINLQKHARISL